ncbi:hypothetical protein FC19_GL000966 [Liquorilactobacillus aquaticus DSM 21051]|uniref:Nucleotidyltransferase family protein n=1 Tax=Liquorilactobacillus aquaticus DSM 21051 TaxID=1423725 RepID=A0A0R2D8M6_9LACO|nr:nucleotidyltransferase family protein [Liquorilactobacillus aquaticus]KRM96668.1 hypothetical protein FC19_GL000966 [Liquorilactobacillus aquaticus DSM 21051]
MKYKQELNNFIKKTPEFMELLRIINSLHLQNWALCAGTVRNLVWCAKMQQPYSILQNNIDIIYSDQSETYEQLLTQQAIVTQKYSKYLWNLQNIALTTSDSRQPYGKNLRAAIASIPETCSAVGVYLENANIEIIAPYGLEDLFNLEAHPTNLFMADSKKMQYYRKRMLRKNWPAKWPETAIFDN